MANYSYSDPFSVCFNILKLRYVEYDNSLTNLNILKPNDKVNVFINMETVFKHLSMIPELEKKLVLQRDFEEILISNILNLAGHYKRFFKDNNLDTNVYLYQTDFESDEFNQFKYNDEFRSYYLVKYNSNPKFVYLTDALKESILPNVKTYCEFIPNIYYISAKNIEGSLVPYIISKEDPSRMNLIIGGEFYDTQYSLIPKFIDHYIHKGPGYNMVTCTPIEHIKGITRKSTEEITPMMKFYDHYNFYCALLSVLGDRTRSIDSMNGIGPKVLQKYLENGMQRNEIQLSINNPNIIGDIFHDDDLKEDFVNNFYCMNIPAMYEELTYSQKLSIYNQRSDRLDNNSLIKLNNTKFYNHPLILESLLL